MVTIVEGIDDVAIDINKLAKILKSSCAAGTVKDVQLSCKESTRKELLKFSNKMAIRWRCGNGRFNSYAIYFKKYSSY